jgi:hypothetical protein
MKEILELNFLLFLFKYLKKTEEFIYNFLTFVK